MNNLLQIAVAAHGGLERWNQIKSIKVAASITGAIWFVKSQGDSLKNIVMTADTRRQRMITDFPGQDKRFVFEPQRILIEKTDGNLIESRDNPEASFAGHVRETPWDLVHVAYFQGEALWTYLNIPFLYTRRLRYGRDFVDPGRKRNLEALASSLSREREEPYAGADFMLRA